MVEVSVVCEASLDLAAQVSAGALELALVTDHPSLHGFELLREEPLVWAAAERFRVVDGAPIPLALGSSVCIWRRAAEDALAVAPRATRGLFFSKNFSAIGTVVRAGWRRRRCRPRWLGMACAFLGAVKDCPIWR